MVALRDIQIVHGVIAELVSRLRATTDFSDKAQ